MLTQPGSHPPETSPEALVPGSLHRFDQRGFDQPHAGLDPAVAAGGWWSLVCTTTLWWLGEREPLPRAELIRSLVLLHPLVAAPGPGAVAAGRQPR